MCAPCAAQAGWIGFVGVPSARYAKSPEAIEPTMPSERVVVSASAPATRATAAAPPRTPSTCSFASSATSIGMSSRVREVAKPAIVSAAVISHRPVLVGTGKRVLHLGCVSLVHHERPPELDHDLTALVHAAATHRDDAHARPGGRLPQLE